MTSEELRNLIDDALNGTISEADFIRLEAELSVSSAARREYYDRVTLSALLEIEATSQDEDPDEIVRTTKRRSILRWGLAIAGMTAVCASLLFVFVSQWQVGLSHDALEVANDPPLINAEEEQQSSGFAILSGQSDAIWKGDPLSEGGIVPPGEIELVSGLAQFELFSGVTLVVEGEATFSILSPMEVSIVRGKVRARVPEPAQGFRLLTNVGDVVDLGTEFAVDVSPDRSEVHVLDGEIEWHPTGHPMERLIQGDATLFSNQGQTKILAAPESFVSTQDLERRIHEQLQTRREQWNLKCEELSQDKRLIAHYRLTTASVTERQLPNLASSAKRRASKGAVVAAMPAYNRWGESASALDFSPAGSRVRLQVPGEYQHLTLVSWVRINSLDRWYNSLFLTDGHEQGEPHWQIMDDGRLFFSIKKRDKFDRSKGEQDKHIFYSPSFWSPSLSGRWLMIATVYDGTNREVTHYLNGEVLSQEAIPEEYLVHRIRVGDASLCNWGLPEWNKPDFAIRNLNGSMDEFLLFSSPLTATEIEQLYEVSRP